MAAWGYDDLRAACRLIADNAKNTNTIGIAIEALTLLNDRRYPTGTKKRSHLLHILRGELDQAFRKACPASTRARMPRASSTG